MVKSDSVIPSFVPQSDVAEVLLGEELIQKRVRELGKQISLDYQETLLGSPLLILVVLKGAFVFAADLVRALQVAVEIDYLAFESYGKKTQSDRVHLLQELKADVRGRHILVVDDIFDTGKTLEYTSFILASSGAASVKLCTFLFKPERVETDLRANYVGFSIPNRFVVGYGMDVGGQLRSLRCVAVLRALLALVKTATRTTTHRNGDHMGEGQRRRHKGMPQDGTMSLLRLVSSSRPVVMVTWRNSASPSPSSRATPMGIPCSVPRATPAPSANAAELKYNYNQPRTSSYFSATSCLSAAVSPTGKSWTTPSSMPANGSGVGRRRGFSVGSMDDSWRDRWRQGAREWGGVDAACGEELEQRAPIAEGGSREDTGPAVLECVPVASAGLRSDRKPQRAKGF